MESFVVLLKTNMKLININIAKCFCSSSNNFQVLNFTITVMDTVHKTDTRYHTKTDGTYCDHSCTDVQLDLV